MALFHFEKKKKTNCAPVCTCGCTAGGNAEDTKNCCIKVLGAGCKSCRAQYENTKTAVMAMKLSVEPEYITDMQKIMEYGVMRMPALVVNERVVSQGKVLSADDVEKLLRQLGF